jgi:hypothetical protein
VKNVIFLFLFLLTFLWGSDTLSAANKNGAARPPRIDTPSTDGPDDVEMDDARCQRHLKSHPRPAREHYQASSESGGREDTTPEFPEWGEDEGGFK